MLNRIHHQYRVVHRQELADALIETFDASPAQCRTVARAADDLAATDQYHADVGAKLTTNRVLMELQDAPDAFDVVDRWNWWMGALELAYGEYNRFRVQQWAPD